MVNVNPIKIQGNWNEGYALDIHTLSSEFIGYDEYDHPRFDTKYSPLGDLLHQLKYGNNVGVLSNIVDTVASFIKFKWKIHIDLILPIPPSKTDRKTQPVEAIADGVGKNLTIKVAKNVLIKTKDTGQLKNVDIPEERTKILKNAFQLADHIVENKDILLLDDLYRSGATLKAITDLLQKYGKTNRVYVLTLTRTRVNS
ncbi:MAG: ComF family protein [Dehalococcoidia bacterium]|jgi:predicted amidophosphoribosyltransferase